MSETPHVVWSVTPDQSQSPYIEGVVSSLEDSGWQVSELSVRNLATTEGQIIHVQWPEHISRGEGLPRTLAKHVRAVGILAALQARNHQLVVTAHNIVPHGTSDQFDSWFRAQVLKRAAALVLLIPGHESELRAQDQIGPNTKVVTIEHPMNRDVAVEGAEIPSRSESPDTLLILGLIHPYHRILEFVDALASKGSTRPVAVVGKVGDPALVELLQRRSERHEWLTVLPGYVSDSELEPLIARTAAIVSLQTVPFNSGGPYYALPRNIPTVLSEGAQGKQLITELGNEWIFEVPFPESSLDLAKLDAWLKMERTPPDLSLFSAETAAEKHIELYEFLLQSE